MSVQLNSSYLRRSYQLLAKLDSGTLSVDEAFEQASDTVYKWVKTKFSRIFRQMPYYKSSYDDKRDGNELGVIYDEQKGRFILRGAHPDVSIPGRMWITDVQISKDDDVCLLAVRLSVTSLQSCTEDVPFSTPNFVRTLISGIGVCDVIRITGKKHLLSTQEDISGFLSFLENPNRHLPAILVTPCFSYGDSIHDGYMIDATQLAADLSGVAHIFEITQEANDVLSERIGKQWSAFNGAVRTYYPGFSLEESDYYQHPFLTSKSIRVKNSIEDNGPDLCMYEIEGYVKNYTVSQRIPWEEYGIDFYLVAYQNRLRELRAASNQSRKQLIISYEDQIAQLQKQSDENLSLADSYARDCEALQEEIDQQRQRIRQLSARIETLGFQLQTVTGNPTELSIPEDGTYIGVEEWINQYYPNKLYLHPRAKRSLKDASYSDVKLVYRCLKLLATSYYNYRLGLISYDDFMTSCKQVDPGLDERGAITDIAAGMQGETYFVRYNGRKQKLERHLAKGSNKDRRFCLRIYYFWDEQDQLIVIGDLPHHLDTSAT